MLTETRRNREMCNQIARKVFFNQSHMTKVAPVGAEVSMIEWEWVAIRFGVTSDWMKKRREFLGQFFGVVEEKSIAFRHSNKTA